MVDSASSATLLANAVNANSFTTSRYTATSTKSGADFAALAITTTTVDNALFNLGYNQRLAIAAGRSMVFKIPLKRYFGFCRYHQKVMVGTRHNIKFTKNSNSNIFISSQIADTAAHTAILKYLDISLWVPYIKPNLAAKFILEKSLADGGTSMINFRRTQVRKQVFATGLKNMIWDISSESEKVHSLVVFLIPTTSLDNQQHNNAVFSNFLIGVDRAYVKLGSYKYPETDFSSTITTTENDYIRFFNEYQKLSDSNGIDVNPAISYSQFGLGYPMYCFDLSSQPEGLFTKGNVVDLRLHIEFNQQLTVPNNETITAYCCIFSERQLQMDIINRKMHINVV
jgi:hypothetical protein